MNIFTLVCTISVLDDILCTTGTVSAHWLKIYQVCTIRVPTVHSVHSVHTVHTVHTMCTLRPPDVQRRCSGTKLSLSVSFMS